MSALADALLCSAEPPPSSEKAVTLPLASGSGWRTRILQRRRLASGRQAVVGTQHKRLQRYVL